MCRFVFPIYAGSRRVRGLDLPLENTYVINQGSKTGQVREVVFKLFGIAPRLVQALRNLDCALVRTFPVRTDSGFASCEATGSVADVTFHGSDATVTDLRYNKAHLGHRRYLAKRPVLQQGAAQFVAVSEFIQRTLGVRFSSAQARRPLHRSGHELFSPRSGETASSVVFVGRLSKRRERNI